MSILINKQENIYLLETVGGGGGVTMSQVWVGGVPHPRSGRGIPGIPPGQVWMVGGGGGTLPPPGLDGVPPPPIRQSSIASTCYVAGSMPLAFTQEDFLVLYLFVFSVIDTHYITPTRYRMHRELPLLSCFWAKMLRTLNTESTRY